MSFFIFTATKSFVFILVIKICLKSCCSADNIRNVQKAFLPGFLMKFNFFSKEEQKSFQYFPCDNKNRLFSPGGQVLGRTSRSLGKPLSHQSLVFLGGCQCGTAQEWGWCRQGHTTPVVSDGNWKMTKGNVLIIFDATATTATVVLLLTKAVNSF